MEKRKSFLALYPYTFLIISYIIAWYFIQDIAYFHKVDNYFHLAIIFSLLLLLESQPLNIGKTQLTFTMVVSFVIFLKYGLLIELILTQLSFVIVLSFKKKSRSFRRLILNLTIFSYTSLLSALVFYLFGGTHEKFLLIGNYYYFISFVLYVFSYFFFNQFFLFLVLYLEKKLEMKEFWRTVEWDSVTYALSIPLSSVLYWLDTLFSLKGFIIGASLILMFSFIFKFYGELKITNRKLKILNKVINTISSELDLSNLLPAINNSLTELVNFQNSIIFLVDDETQTLIPLAYNAKEREEKEDSAQFKIKLGEALSGRVAVTGKAEIVSINKINYNEYKVEHEPLSAQFNKSLLSVPLKFQKEIIGVLTLGGHEENQYDENDLMVVNILANQIAIAIKNAEKYEKVEKRTLIDGLTGLNNYRYFEKILDKKVREAAEENSNLSVILLDIDHFKPINDQYGHLAGNEVLKETARIIKEAVRKQDIVSRYGGEEFTVVVPGANEEEALEIAERIRYQIEHTPFIISNSLSGEEELILRVTVSIGVAVYPVHGMLPIDLVRNADHAMYFGAKQQGRNRVALYHEAV